MGRKLEIKIILRLSGLSCMQSDNAPTSRSRGWAEKRVVSMWGWRVLIIGDAVRVGTIKEP